MVFYCHSAGYSKIIFQQLLVRVRVPFELPQKEESLLGLLKQVSCLCLDHVRSDVTWMLRNP